MVSFVNPGLILIALTAALAMPVGAQAKISCRDGSYPTSRQLDGVPPTPETGVVYNATIVTASKYGGNPEPLLFLLRCEAGEEKDSAQLTPEGSQSTIGRAQSRFAVEFKQPGHWLVTLMDRSGRFFNAGHYEVRSPSAPTGPADEAGPGPAAVGGLLGGAAIAGGVALLIRRRFSGRP